MTNKELKDWEEKNADKAGDSIAKNFEKKGLVKGARNDFLKGVLAVLVVGGLVIYLISIVL